MVILPTYVLRSFWKLQVLSLQAALTKSCPHLMQKNNWSTVQVESSEAPLMCYLLHLWQVEMQYVKKNPEKPAQKWLAAIPYMHSFSYLLEENGFEV